MGFAGYAGYEGWNDAARITGKNEKDVTWKDKLAATGVSVASDLLTFGIVDSKDAYDIIKYGDASATGQHMRHVNVLNQQVEQETIAKIKTMSEERVDQYEKIYKKHKAGKDLSEFERIILKNTQFDENHNITQKSNLQILNELEKFIKSNNQSSVSKETPRIAKKGEEIKISEEDTDGKLSGIQFLHSAGVASQIVKQSDASINESIKKLNNVLISSVEPERSKTVPDILNDMTEDGTRFLNGLNEAIQDGDLVKIKSLQGFVLKYINKYNTSLVPKALEKNDKTSIERYNVHRKMLSDVHEHLQSIYDNIKTKNKAIQVEHDSYKSITPENIDLNLFEHSDKHKSNATASVANADRRSFLVTPNKGKTGNLPKTNPPSVTSKYPLQQSQNGPAYLYFRDKQGNNGNNSNTQTTVINNNNYYTGNPATSGQPLHVVYPILSQTGGTEIPVLHGSPNKN